MRMALTGTDKWQVVVFCKWQSRAPTSDSDCDGFTANWQTQRPPNGMNTGMAGSK